MTVERQQLTQQIDVAPWDLLRAHLERGGIIVVSRELDLCDVAYAIAADKKSDVERLLANAMIAKPTAEQIRTWDIIRYTKIFSTIIISPFVLIQEAP